MDKNSTLTMLTSSRGRGSYNRHSDTPTDSSMEEHQYFFIDIFHNLMDSNLSKVSTDSTADPEFIKPKRPEMSYCKDSHICLRFGLSLCEVLVVHIAQHGAECAYLPPHGNVAGYTRRRSCHSVWIRSLHPLC